MEKLKRNKKFLLGFVALIVAVAMVSVGVTLAALNGTTPLPETNVLVIGNVDIDLNDVYEEKTLNPGTTGVQKEVSVTNKGSLPCYVRILVKKEWYKPGEYGVAGKTPVVSTANATTATENQTFIKDGTKGLSVDMIAPTFSHTSDWVKGDRVDGYDCYYYQTALSAGATTSTLMDTFGFLETADGVTFDKDTYAGYVGVISVKAQAVQSDWLEDYDGTKGQLEKSGGKIVGWKNITIQA